LRRVASLAVSLAIVGGLAAAQPAAASTKTMSGTIDGSDGRAVNALIGFDIHDKNGRKIDMNGKAAYSAYKVINPTLPSTGGSKAGRTTTWTLSGIPANAAYVYIEVYPKQKHPSNPRIQLKTDQTRYGMALRRALPASSRGVQLRLPLVCGNVGALTGGIKGRVTKGGKLVTASRVRAWSIAPDKASSKKILGWNMGQAKMYQGYYNYVIPNLAVNQGYTVWVTYGGRTIKKTVRNVSVCKGSVMNFAF